MRRTQLHRHWRLLNNHQRRGPAWLANRYRKKLFLAAAGAWLNSGRYPEPVYGLLKSIDVEPLPQNFPGKAVVSFRAAPFNGGLYQAYPWTYLIYLTPRQLQAEIISSLKHAVRDKEKRKSVAGLDILRQARRQ